MASDLFNTDQLDGVTKTVKRTFIAAIVVWGLGVLLSLTLLAAGAYVAWHFISKFW